MDKGDEELVDKKNTGYISRVKMMYIAGSVIGTVLLGVIFFNNKNAPQSIPQNQIQQVAENSQSSTKNRPMTDAEIEKEKGKEFDPLEVDILDPEKEREKRLDDFHKAQDRMNNPIPTSYRKSSSTDGMSGTGTGDVQNNRLRIDDMNYYVFDDSILLPLDDANWTEYEIGGSSDGRYEKIMEYYLPEESPSNWSQKFTIHRVNVENPDCFDFVDKLVNGVIMSVSEQLHANDIELKVENLSFNYLRKEKENTLMYWELRDIPLTYDETQFVRAFIAPISKHMYLVTYTLKSNVNALSEETVMSSIRVLDTMQELKSLDESNDGSQ